MPYTVLMLASTSFFSDYGNHVRIWEEARAIQRRGHRLVLATYHNGDDMPGLNIRRSWDVPWIKRAVVGSSRHKLYLDVGLGWRALRVALTIRPDIIHAHTHEAAAIGLPLQQLLNAPLILDYQGSMTGEMLDHGFLSKASPLYVPATRLERFLNSRADAVLPSTHNAAELLRRDGSVYPERLHAVPDGVDTERFRPYDGSPAWAAQRDELRAQLGIPPGRRLVVYIGLLAPYQGTNVLIETAQLLSARRPDTHFLIMGHPDPHSYRRYAESLGVGEHVTLPGRIIYRDLHSYLALGEVAVAPKMSLTEGNGKIANYMAMGLPTVAFETPVAREILADTGLYARLGSAEDLAAQLELALDDRDLAARLGAAARARRRRALVGAGRAVDRGDLCRSHGPATQGAPARTRTRRRPHRLRALAGLQSCIGHSSALDTHGGRIYTASGSVVLAHTCAYRRGGHMKPATWTLGTMTPLPRPRARSHKDIWKAVTNSTVLARCVARRARCR